MYIVQNRGTSPYTCKREAWLGPITSLLREREDIALFLEEQVHENYQKF